MTKCDHAWCEADADRAVEYLTGDVRRYCDEHFEDISSRDHVEFEWVSKL